MHYNGLVAAVEKRRSHGWQAHASYTWSATKGLQAPGRAARRARRSARLRHAYLTFGQDPNTLTNADGRLPNDRPHMVRVMASADVPQTGLIAAANVRHFTGKPWAATTVVSLTQGDVRISWRRVARVACPRKRSSTRAVEADLAWVHAHRAARRRPNVLDDTAEEAIASDDKFSRNFGLPTALVDPRRAMIGVRFALPNP